jgi:hypothetical protein
MAAHGERRGLRERLIRRLGSPGRIEAKLGAVHDSVVDAQRDLGAAHGELRQRLELLEARLRQVEADSRRAAEIGRHTYDQEPDNRRRLWEARRSAEYDLAYTEAEPLVSFLVPTYTSFETLRDVALPSILGQTYSNLEVIVVGDAAPPETAAAIASLDDPRVTYYNRTVRGPYPDDPARRWFVVGTPPVNDALALAQGRWIGILGDDDAVRPDHTELLLAAARDGGFEHVYGRQQVNFAEGPPLTLGVFPPRLGQWGMQAAIQHAGLRFFESELSDAIYEEPNDWSKCRRMLRAGVRFGMIDDVVVDKHESRRRSAAEWEAGAVPRVE